MYRKLDQVQAKELLIELQKRYEDIVKQELSLDMSRGKPSPEQLDLSHGLDTLSWENEDYFTKEGWDARNYGCNNGILEARELFAEILDVPADQILMGGNASLALMYDILQRSMIFGVAGEKPWVHQDKVKFLCPVPGFERHFAILERFGIEMINIEIFKDGPDMDTIEKLVSEDEAIKGIWLVPKYHNPIGVTYSDECVKRFASLKPKAKDFRLYWDNAYVLHDITEEKRILNIIDEAKKAGNEDLPLVFASTSKITYAGAGVSVVASSRANIDQIEKEMELQIINHDKMNQVRHVRFLKNLENAKAHMQKHAQILKPKLELVLETFEKEFSGLDEFSWTEPSGGYFITANLPDETAKKTYDLCKEAGLVLTGAGSTYPYRNDPRDREIRIAFSYPGEEELRLAAQLFSVCAKIIYLKQILNI